MNTVPWSYHDNICIFLNVALFLMLSSYGAFKVLATLTSHKRNISKQSGPRPDTAERVCTVRNVQKRLQNMIMLKISQTPAIKEIGYSKS